MTKKCSLLLLAVAVLVLAIPAMASATKAEIPEGTLAPVGTEITATGTAVTFQSSLLGAITCSTLNLNSKITKNNGTTFEAAGENKSPTQSGCVNGSKAVIVTSFNTSDLQSISSGVATMSFVAVIDIGPLVCTYTGTNVIGSYTAGTNVITFTAATGISGSPVGCGTVKLTAKFAFKGTGSGVGMILKP